MERRVSADYFGLLFLALAASVVLIALFPARSYAVTPTGSSGVNLECLPLADPDPCQCGPKFVPNKGCSGIMTKFMCPCNDSTNGHTIPGKCMATGQCKATSPSGGGDLKSLMDAVKGLMDMLKGKGGGGDSPPPPTTPTTGTGCMGATFQTSDISQISNPCAQYVPSVSGSITNSTTGSNSLLDALLGNTSSDQTGTTDTNTNSDTNTNTDTTNTNTAGSSSSTAKQPRIIFSSTSTGGIAIPGGQRGDIEVRWGGATLIGGSRDVQGNTEVAGFYGSETSGEAPQGLVAGWCESRPWATNFLSKIVTPTFFDNLCAWRGYQVGTPPTLTQVPVVQKTTRPKPAATSTPATTTPTVTPKADIWAVPASVPLGGRTSIFWNTQGVTSCTETSPSGNFNQTSLSGGAATVSITAATTFTITCKVSDGTEIKNSVVVNLKI